MRVSSAVVVVAVACSWWLGACNGSSCSGAESSCADAPDSGLGGSDVDASTATGPLAYAPCSDETRVGVFSVALEARFTGVDGDVYDAVDPARAPRVASREGDCRLLRASDSFCDPACGSGETCGPDGCVAAPRKQSVGDVTMTGLRTSPLTMSPRVPGNHYTNPETLPQPGFEEGAQIAMRASGGAYAAFALRGRGVAMIETSGEPVHVESGSSARITWTPPAIAQDAVRMNVRLDIARHGGTPARIECDAVDDGAFEVPEVLVTELVNLGFSGFPAVDLTRRSSDSTNVEGLGCVELEVAAATRVEVEVPGLVSCSVNEDCPDGQTCSLDLFCEE